MIRDHNGAKHTHVAALIDKQYLCLAGEDCSLKQMWWIESALEMSRCQALNSRETSFYKKYTLHLFDLTLIGLSFKMLKCIVTESILQNLSIHDDIDYLLLPL